MDITPTRITLAIRTSIRPRNHKYAAINVSPSCLFPIDLLRTSIEKDTKNNTLRSARSAKNHPKNGYHLPLPIVFEPPGQRPHATPDTNHKMWSNGLELEIRCRLCLGAIAANEPRFGLFKHDAAVQLQWKDFLLQTMGLRFVGSNGLEVPRKLCDLCHQNLLIAFGAFRMAQRSTKELRQEHEWREKCKRPASRNFDDAAGRKTYVHVDDEKEAEDVNAAEIADLAKACVDDDEAEHSEWTAEPAVSDVTTLTDLAGACDGNDDDSPFERNGQNATASSISDAVITTSSTTQSAATFRTSEEAIMLREHVVLRQDLLHELRKTAAKQRSSVTDMNFVSNRLKDTNLGFRMMQRHGWKPGETLGLNGSGISEPIVYEI